MTWEGLWEEWGKGGEEEAWALPIGFSVSSGRREQPQWHGESGRQVGRGLRKGGQDLEVMVFKLAESQTALRLTFSEKMHRSLQFGIRFQGVRGPMKPRGVDH